MNDTRINKLMDILLVLSAVSILVGVFFKLQHYPYGNQLVWGGFMAQFVFSSIEINRLKKYIRKLKE